MVCAAHTCTRYAKAPSHTHPQPIFQCGFVIPSDRLARSADLSATKTRSCVTVSWARRLSKNGVDRLATVDTSCFRTNNFFPPTCLVFLCLILFLLFLFVHGGCVLVWKNVRGWLALETFWLEQKVTRRSIKTYLRLSPLHPKLRLTKTRLVSRKRPARLHDDGLMVKMLNWKNPTGRW